MKSHVYLNPLFLQPCKLLPFYPFGYAFYVNTQQGRIGKAVGGGDGVGSQSYGSHLVIPISILRSHDMNFRHLYSINGLSSHSNI